MQIIVCNIGSSSFKFQLLAMPGERQRARGYTERVGTNDASITYWVDDRQVYSEVAPMPSHRDAVQHALQFLQRDEWVFNVAVIQDVARQDYVKRSVSERQLCSRGAGGSDITTLAEAERVLREINSAGLFDARSEVL